MPKDPHHNGFLDLVIHNNRFADIISLIVTILVGLGIYINESSKGKPQNVVPIVKESQSPETNLHNPETNLHNPETKDHNNSINQKPQQTQKPKTSLYPLGIPPISAPNSKLNPVKSISNTDSKAQQPFTPNKLKIEPIRVKSTKPQL